MIALNFFQLRALGCPLLLAGCTWSVDVPTKPPRPATSAVAPSPKAPSTPEHDATAPASTGAQASEPERSRHSSTSTPTTPAPSSPPTASPDDDPDLSTRLTIVTPEPAALKTAEFRAARAVFYEVVRGVRAHVLSEEKSAPCEQALVTDGDGNVRAFVQIGGSDDSYGEIRHFFDATGALRLLLYFRSDVAGGRFHDLVAFDRQGNVVVCKHIVLHSGMPAPNLCFDERPEPRLDPDVKDALQPSGTHRPHNRFRESLQTVNPQATFNSCD